MKEMMETLCSLSSDVWGRYAFSRDPINHRLREEDRLVMTDRANACGRQQAAQLVSRYGRHTAREYAALLGLKLKEKDSAGDGSYVMFASFQEPDQITVYMENLTHAQQLIEENGLGELLGHVDMEEMLIFHELFHVLEAREPAIYTKTERFTLWKIGRLQGKTKLVALSEIAAMAFTQECLSINFSPYVFDVLLPWYHNPKQAEKLYLHILNLRRDNV